ncbi:hypothetical protein NDU88_001883 [Pleurodeles waltl]|uniref:Uncharacterized protein n=1 Tax=Pleurodeles waltl TaxID=8319 RepID=A0AAV7RC65_PLEWA|nr:hypothetical protein NDU88_001883 [Pleurodeles waltl]
MSRPAALLLQAPSHPVQPVRPSPAASSRASCHPSECPTALKFTGRPQAQPCMPKSAGPHRQHEPPESGCHIVRRPERPTNTVPISVIGPHKRTRATPIHLGCRPRAWGGHQSPKAPQERKPFIGKCVTMSGSSSSFLKK